MNAPVVAAILCLSVLAGAAEAQHRHESRYGYTLAERVEYRDDDALVWDLQGRYGGDYHGIAWKTEGTWASGKSAGDDFEVQLLYDRAWTAFFDLQLGLRYAHTSDDTPNSAVDGGLAYAVAGVQGLFPYRVESDLALFLSEDGDVTGRTEFEKDFLLSERWVLQPRAELDFALQDIPERGVDAGVTEVAVGLRLRYELTRKFAPYLGLGWEKHYDSLTGDEDATTVVAGLRFWF